MEPAIAPRVIAYGLRRSGTPVKTVILGLVPGIARGTAVDFIRKILMPVRLEILGTSPRMTVFGGNLPYAIPLPLPPEYLPPLRAGAPVRAS